MPSFEVGDKDFLLDGQPIQLISGAMHYFRVVPEYWRDRLAKLRACGLNAVETYVPWNLHEPQPGTFEFGGMADIESFIEIAHELGLLVIVRPGPYICAEWDLGGLPPWLLADPAMRLRTMYQPYLDAVDAYFDELLPRLVPFQCTNGGPIIAMQVENEYGSYGSDKAYLRYLEAGMKKRGVDCLLFTADGAEDHFFLGGGLPGVLKTGTFGSRPEESLANLRKFQQSGPLMCMEYWNGWFDHWTEGHHKRDHEDAAQVLDAMLAQGASVNFYMFHGGTNFGFSNGANHGERYEPTITSYDYDAPLDEAGDPTPKYAAFREVIAKYVDIPGGPIPAPARKMSLPPMTLSERACLFESLDALSIPVERKEPGPMEALGQNSGFILYSTRIAGPREKAQLFIQGVRDRALAFLDGQYLGVLDRWEPEKALVMDVPPEGARLDLLVESMGHINYGPLLHDRKGITEGVRIGLQFQCDWTIHPIPFDGLSQLTFYQSDTKVGPALYRGVFRVDKIADTFLALPGWTKGVAFVNGFNLGRYWVVGPQQTLYAPGPLLKEGENELVVFELHDAGDRQVEFRDTPDLGPVVGVD